MGLTFVQNCRILPWYKLKAYADEEFKVAQMMNALLDMGENKLGKGESNGSQHFFLFPQCFQKLSPSGSLKLRVEL